MEKNREVTAQSAWQAFAQSGRVGDYLSYCAKARKQQEELLNASEDPGPYSQGTEYR